MTEPPDSADDPEWSSAEALSEAAVNLIDFMSYVWEEQTDALQKHPLVRVFRIAESVTLCILSRVERLLPH
jgi:hypothetical protein